MRHNIILDKYLAFISVEDLLKMKAASDKSIRASAQLGMSSQIASGEEEKAIILDVIGKLSPYRLAALENRITHGVNS